MKVVAFSVTAGDIAAGCRRAADACPAWRAIARALPGGAEVAVFADVVYVDRRPYPAPLRLRHFVRQFDTFGPVRPFAAVLEVEERVAA